MNTETRLLIKESTQEELLEGHALNVLSIISESSVVSQREVAQKAGISVGLVNLTVKRLVQTGYVKVTNLNSRKAEYFLTPRGISEITSKSYQYLTKTIQTYQQFCERGKTFIKKLIQQGHQQFIVLGDGEVANLIMLTLKDIQDPSIQWRHETSAMDSGRQNGEVILDCRTDCWANSPGVSVLSQLLESNKK